jgi:alpha-mannosidase
MSAVASGPLAQTLTIRYEYKHSDADILIRAYRDLPYLDLDIRVRWQEKRSLLKLCLPFVEIREVKVQGPGATIDKHTNEQEEPLHGWLRTETLEILQDGLFAYDRVDDHIRLTLVRSNIFGYHIDTIPHLDFPYHYTDIGSHYVKIRLYPHQGEASEEIDTRFAAFIEPFKVLRNNL